MFWSGRIRSQRKDTVLTKIQYRAILSSSPCKGWPPRRRAPSRCRWARWHSGSSGSRARRHRSGRSGWTCRRSSQTWAGWPGPPGPSWTPSSRHLYSTVGRWWAQWWATLHFLLLVKKSETLGIRHLYLEKKNCFYFYFFPSGKGFPLCPDILQHTQWLCLFSKISIVKDAGFETVYKQQRKSGLKQNVADLIKGSSRKCGDVRFLANGNSRKASLKIKLSCHPWQLVLKRYVLVSVLW